MKRAVLVVAFILSTGLSAHADNTVYNNILKRHRGNAELHADGLSCDQIVGPDRNGVPTSTRYKRCMLSHGWRFQYTTRTPRQKTWTDPETGLTCHAILGGLGSACSNF
jgi:hypothetical protein